MSLQRCSFEINEFESFEGHIYVRITENNLQELWFKADEFLEHLGYEQPSEFFLKEIGPAAKCPWIRLKRLNIDYPDEWSPQTPFVNESGLRRLVQYSHKEDAELFQKTLFEQIVPKLVTDDCFRLNEELETAKLQIELYQSKLRLAKCLRDNAALRHSNQEHNEKLGYVKNSYEKELQYLQDTIEKLRQENDYLKNNSINLHGFRNKKP